MTWQPEVIDADHVRVLATDGEQVAVADLERNVLQVLAVSKYAPLGHGAWEPLTNGDLDRWRQALPHLAIMPAVVASGDWDPEKHPRDERGRFGDKGELDVSPPTTTKGVRDQLVEAWRENFEKGVGPGFVEALDRRLAAGERPGNVTFMTREMYGRDSTHQEDMILRQRLNAIGGGKVPDFRRYEFNLVKAFVDDDKRALGAIRANGTKRAAEYSVEAVRAEYRTRAEEAIGRFNTDPRAQALMERYGAPRMTLAATSEFADLKSANTPDGQYAASTKQILLFENAFDRLDPVTSKTVDWEPPKAGASNVSGGSLLGTLTHEFGHHIDYQRTEAQQDEWRAMARARASEYQADAKATSYGAAMDKTISYYSVEGNGSQHSIDMESFAETFAAVMAPGYTREKYDPSNHQMLSYMEDVVAGRR